MLKNAQGKVSANMKERQEAIRKFIEEHGEALISELAVHFSSWSEMTIRRDLEYLEKNRYILRTKGGARILPASYGLSEDVYGEREKRNYPQKQEIARKAAELVDEESGIYLDAGSTMMALARQLPDVNTAVITSAPNIALELAWKKQNPAVILLGGTLSRKTISISGLNVLDQLRNLNIDTAFMCASGYTEKAGFSVGSQHESELKRTVIERARRVVMLFDSSKSGVLMPFTFARPENIDVLVTDCDFPENLRKVFQDADVTIL